MITLSNLVPKNPEKSGIRGRKSGFSEAKRLLHKVFSNGVVPGSRRLPLDAAILSRV